MTIEKFVTDLLQRKFEIVEQLRSQELLEPKTPGARLERRRLNNELAKIDDALHKATRKGVRET